LLKQQHADIGRVQKKNIDLRYIKIYLPFAEMTFKNKSVNPNLKLYLAGKVQRVKGKEQIKEKKGRLSFDGLSGLVQNNLGGNPCSGEVFIFINNSRDKIKLLHWQRSGFVLYYKRLEKGTFELPRYDSKVGSITLDYATLVMIVDGLSIKNIQKRKRYQPNF
jgi:transposase